MAGASLETAETLLTGLLEDIDDEQARFKIRTALQLVVVAQDEHDRASESLEAADLDPELEDRLRELGYLE